MFYKSKAAKMIMSANENKKLARPESLATFNKLAPFRAGEKPFQ